MDDFFIPCPVSQWVLKMDNNITLKQALLDIKRILKDVPLDKRDYKWSMTMFWMRQRFRTWVVRWSAGKEVEDTIPLIVQGTTIPMRNWNSRFFDCLKDPCLSLYTAFGCLPCIKRK